MKTRASKGKPNRSSGDTSQPARPRPNPMNETTAWLLTRYQTHWLERFLLPLLAVGFSITVLSLVRLFAPVFLPQVSLPGWLFWVGLLVALEGVYTSGFHIKARSPFTLILAELFFILGIVYLLLRLSGAATSYPFFSLTALKQPDIYVPLLLILLGRHLAVSSGQRFVRIGNIEQEIGDRAAATLSWEQESLMSEHNVETGRAQAVGYFARRVLFYSFMVCLLSAIAVESYSHRVAAMSGWSRSVTIGTVFLLLFGFSIQGCIYFYRLQTIWRKGGIQVSPHLPGQWLKSSALFILGIILMASLLPANLSPLNFTQLVQTVFTALAPVLNMTPSPRRDVVSHTTPSFSGSQAMQPGELSWLTAFLSFLMICVTALLAGLALLSLIGFLLLTFLGKEWERLQGLARIPVLFYFWVKDTFSQLIRLLRAGVQQGKQVVASLRAKRKEAKAYMADSFRPEQKGPPPSAPALYVRHLFVALIHTAARYGLGVKPGQTALEYTGELERHVGDADGNLQTLARWYQEARYSSHRLTGSIKPVVRAAWQQVVAAIRNRFEEK